ncbi:hypothetical protein GCM10010124_21000 [Pilimelia terevasa]|uniref:Uncharacterized protein n=1 Tax=Pilimelia terevasa TaxID=53372 RepID=A0A8J3BK63_9ACTN|nr:hypothetical protein [Pilimelia terevasa]GGK28172.1 hypothetical protein GCM10010124_21000 [Pilimelia terevasa]
MGYDWLPAALESLRGVQPHEVTQVLAAPRRMPVAAISGGVRIITVAGRTLTGRALIVAVRRIDDFDQLILGARELTPAETARFEQWEATA